jgi:rhodanese-related sulfurtransferase
MKTIPSPPVKIITEEQLALKMRRHDPIEIVNVLKPQDYYLGFIKGSKGIPLEELDHRLAEIDKNKEVITYCTGYECPASRDAAKKLQSRGFKARAYEGGIKEWKKDNLPTE